MVGRHLDVSDLTEHDRIRLIDYFDGRMAPDAHHAFEMWLSESPGRRAEVDRLKLAWQVAGQVTRSEGLGNAALQQILEPRASAGRRPRVDVGARISRWGWSGSAYALAGLIAVVGLAFGWRTLTSLQPQAVAMTTYATNNGERANITLPDGNRVALNVGSRLEVPVDYLRGDRTLRLTGEALFTVVHHQHTPFTVVSGTATARVLGTSFIVRHYATDTAVTVAVRDGRVSLRSTVLSAWEEGIVGRDGRERSRAIDASRFTFASGILSLRSMPLGEAIVELNRWYDMDIRLGDPRLASRTIYGEFAAGTPQDLIAVLEATPHVRVVHEGRVLTLYPRDSK